MLEWCRWWGGGAGKDGGVRVHAGGDGAGGDGAGEGLDADGGVGGREAKR